MYKCKDSIPSSFILPQTDVGLEQTDVRQPQTDVKPW